MNKLKLLSVLLTLSLSLSIFVSPSDGQISNDNWCHFNVGFALNDCSDRLIFDTATLNQRIADAERNQTPIYVDYEDLPGTKYNKCVQKAMDDYNACVKYYTAPPTPSPTPTPTPGGPIGPVGPQPIDPILD